MAGKPGRPKKNQNQTNDNQAVENQEVEQNITFDNKQPVNKEGEENVDVLKQELDFLKNQVLQMTLQQNQNKNEENDDIPLTRRVLCKSSVPGKLIYVSQRQAGYRIVWNDIGSEEYVEFGELLSMRNTQPKFFSNCWIIPQDEDVIKRLNIQDYYKNMFDVDNVDSFFDKPTKQFKEDLQKVPKGVGDAIVKKAMEKIDNGTLDSMKKIQAIEDTFKIELQNIPETKQVS